MPDHIKCLSGYFEQDRLTTGFMRIGILSKNYAAQRLFLDRLPEATYKDIRFYNMRLWHNMHLWILRYLGKLNMSPEKIAERLFYEYKSTIPTRCDLFHFFNTICHDHKRPWVISVESAVPWTMDVTHVVESETADFSRLKDNDKVRKKLQILAQSDCLALLPLSQCSYNIQMELMKQFPKYHDAIKAKTYTLQPPQEPVINDINEKGLTWNGNEQFRFLYVGGNFFRKGGRESLKTLIELHNKYDFHFTIISNLSVDEQKYMYSENEVEHTRQLIAANSNWIEYHNGLPNALVLEKLIHTHVCLLPTWMDTYAYSVLESQACGTPLITTSLRALTDINCEKVGWLINVPVNRLNNPLHTTVEQKEKFAETLSTGLKEKVEYVLNHRNEVKEKSVICLERIKQFHNPKKYADRLKEIYNGNVQSLIQDE